MILVLLLLVSHLFNLFSLLPDKQDLVMSITCLKNYDGAPLTTGSRWTFYHDKQSPTYGLHMPSQLLASFPHTGLLVPQTHQVLLRPL